MRAGRSKIIAARRGVHSRFLQPERTDYSRWA